MAPSYPTRIHLRTSPYFTNFNQDYLRTLPYLTCLTYLNRLTYFDRFTYLTYSTVLHPYPTVAQPPRHLPSQSRMAWRT